MPNKPTQLESADLTLLREKCQEFIDHIERYGCDEFIDDNLIRIERAIASTALDAIFGEDWALWTLDVTKPCWMLK